MGNLEYEKLRDTYEVNSSSQTKSEMTSYLNYGHFVLNYFAKFENFLRHSVTIPSFYGSIKCIPECTFQSFRGCQGRRTGVGVTTVSNSLLLRGWVTKVLKSGDKNRGWKGGGQQYFDFFMLLARQKMPL